MPNSTHGSQIKSVTPRVASDRKRKHTPGDVATFAALVVAFRPHYPLEARQLASIALETFKRLRAAKAVA